MPVEQLAIVEGPMAGLAANATPNLTDHLARIGAWMRQHDVNPWWVTGGAVAGALFSDRAVPGAAKGALLLAAASWLCTKSCQRQIMTQGVI